MSFTVFLGNLPTWVTADDIKQWLAAEDLVADAVKVIRNHETQESKGFAFVEAPTNDEMQSIIRRFDRAPLEDRLLRANPAQPPKGKDAPRGAAPPSAAAGRSTQCHPNRTTSRPQKARWTKSRAVAPQRVCYRAGEGPVSQASPARAAQATPGPLSTPVNASHNRLHYYPSYFQSVAIGLRRAIGHSMKYTWLGCLLVGNLLFAGTQDSELNVNKRYTVDTVIVAGKGWKTNVADQQNDRISSGLRKDLLALIGQKLNPGILDGLAARLKKEFSAREVSHHVLRGDTPDHVRVEFEVVPHALRRRRHGHQVPLRFQAGLERRRRSGIYGATEHLRFRTGQRRRHAQRAVRRNLRALRKQARGDRSGGPAIPVRELSRAMEPEYAGRPGAQPSQTSDAYRDAAEFPADRHHQPGQAADAGDRCRLSTLSEPVSGRAYRGRQRPDYLLCAITGGWRIRNTRKTWMQTIPCVRPPSSWAAISCIPRTRWVCTTG